MDKKDNKSKGYIAIIDDDEAARLSIGQMLRLRNYKVEVFNSAEAALAWIGLPNTDCIISDVKMPGMNGEEFLDQVNRMGLSIPVIMITGHGDIAMAVRCLKNGAYHFVEKPFDDDVLLASVERAVEKINLRRESIELKKRLNMFTPEQDGKWGMIGRSHIMQDLYEEIEVAAKSIAPILIIGETGAGKELIAKAIHSQSNRSDKPFVAINAGALPDTMLESELFGHTKGAFTGAHDKRVGKLISASHGTVLLDEIESISVKAQIGLLRVLEDGLVYPLGQDDPVKVDIRLIATTKVDLKKQVSEGLMREDFYHRIMVLPINAPPLRERTEDIPLLISYFIKQAANRNGILVPNMSEKSLKEMIRYSWPGNVRELKHAVERMVITARDGITGDFSFDEGFDSSRLLSLPATPGKLKDELERTEKIVIENALRDNKGEITTTADSIGISRRALYERMKKYNLNKENYK